MTKDTFEIFKHLPKELQKVSEELSIPVDDFFPWQSVAQKLGIPVILSLKDRVHEDSTESSKAAIEKYYEKVNQDFFKLVDHAREASEGLECNYPEFQQKCPRFKETTAFPHASYQQQLRLFMHAYKEDIIAGDLLYWAGFFGSIPLCNMLLEAGVKPQSIELPPLVQCGTAEKGSIPWLAPLTAQPDNLTNVGFLKVFLEANPLDSVTLTYLLWLMCQNGVEGREAEEIQAMKYLLAKGAAWDASLIQKYPPIIIADDGIHPTFEYPHGHKPLVKQFVESSRKKIAV